MRGALLEPELVKSPACNPTNRALADGGVSVSNLPMRAYAEVCANSGEDG
ncbi:MAG: hypothetical protein J5I81_08910 [Nitrococcus mobilis]|nr:hypothetical protein [Nitrococcus mobilis]